MPLDPTTRDLLRGLAHAAAGRAYSPYSKFRVGAALRTRSGAMFAGCIVENASFGLTICAERNAVFQMVAAGETEPVQIVIDTPTSTPTAPCGALAKSNLNSSRTSLAAFCGWRRCGE